MEKIRIIVEPCICVVKYLSYCYVALLLLFLSLFISFVFLLSYIVILIHLTEVYSLCLLTLHFFCWMMVAETLLLYKKEKTTPTTKFVNLLHVLAQINRF